MRLVASDLCVAFETGVEVSSAAGPVRLRLATTGIKGDWPFLIAGGHLIHHFRRAAKRSESNMEPARVCHWCCAGLRSFPWEDMSESPKFEKTMRSAAAPRTKM